MSDLHILNKDETAYRAENGKVELYAVRLSDGTPTGQVYHFKTIEPGSEIINYANISVDGAVWACAAKCVGPAILARVQPEADNTVSDAEFSLFVKSVNEKLSENFELFSSRSNNGQMSLHEAASRLRDINTKLSGQEWDNFEDISEDDNIKTYDVLCRYLKVELKLPPDDILNDFSNLTEEVLTMSGLCYKEVALPPNWRKHNNGAMLGTFLDGSPIVLLPNKLFGYSVYNPKDNKKIKVTDKIAADISPEAVAAFRKLPPKNINFKDILSFIHNGNIYRELIIILLCSFFAGVIQMIPPIISAQIFDIYVPENLRMILFQVILILAAFELADIGFSIISNLGISRISTKIGISLQAAVWDRLLSLKAPFFTKYTTGELLQKIKGLEQIKQLISVDNIKDIISNLFVFINVIVLYKYCAEITPYVLLMLLCPVIIYAAANLKKYKLNKKYIEAENKSATFNHQSIKGIQRIKVSGAEERIYNVWSRHETEKRYLKSKIAMLDNAFNSFYMFFQFFSAAVVYFLISQTENIAMGAFIAYAATFLILQRSLIKFLRALGTLPELISVCGNIKPILETIPEYNILKTIPKDMSGTLEVNHATFRYGEFGRTIIDDISFRVEEGESIGIVGLSGSGKSTLFKLLMGFYELTSGKIYYGGYDLETIDLRYLRKRLGVVLQSGRVTVGDIYSNVTDNDGRIGLEDVLISLKKAGLDEVVEKLPDGLYTKLEEYPLSEGEKQQLMIARAIVKKNKFIFLDEATSSLDNRAQSMIMKNLRDIPSTKIIIAQRFATVEHCDKIIVIDRGKIVAQGSYEMLAKNPEIRATQP